MKNKQMKCRIWALLLVVALLSSFAVPVFAADTARISFGQVCGKRGEQVTVPVVIENNPGIASFRFRVTYDPTVLTYVSAQSGETMTGGTLKAQWQEEKQELAITWFDVKNLSDDGVIFYLVFQLADTADGQYPLVVSYPPEDIVNASLQRVDMTVTDGCVQTGSELSGTITTFGAADGTVTVRLMAGDEEVAKVETAEGTYRMTNVAPGDYTLVVSKQNHVTRSYSLTVTDQAQVQDVKLHLIGDIDGSGRVNMGDLSIMYAHIRGTKKLTDEYQILVANVNGGTLNIGDFSTLYAHIKGTKTLY